MDSSCIPVELICIPADSGLIPADSSGFRQIPVIPAGMVGGVTSTGSRSKGDDSPYSSDSSSGGSESSSNGDNSDNSESDTSSTGSSSSDTRQRKNNRHGHNHRRRNKSSSHVKSKNLIKPIAPTKYNGQADPRLFHRFVRESGAYLRDGKVKRNRQVFLLSYYLTDKAYDFYTQKVASNEGYWTLKQFYVELFNFCFPIDYRMQLRNCNKDFLTTYWQIR